MRRAFAIISIFCLLTASSAATAAGKRRVRWVKSVYVDAKGIGLSHPEGVACGDGTFVVGDTGNDRLVHFSYVDDAITAESTVPVGKAAPIKVELTSEGEVYFLDGAERRIMRMESDGAEAVELDARSVSSWNSVVPKSFAIDGEDSLYILDIFGKRVVILGADAQFKRELPLPETQGFITDLAIGAQGTIYLVDAVDAVIYAAAQGEKKFSPLGENLKEYVNFPSRITVDATGVIYLVDQYGSGLALIGPDGSFLGRQLGMGWNDGALYYPAQICISDQGTIFIADRNNSRIQMFRAGGSSSPRSGAQETTAAEGDGREVGGEEP